MTLKENGTNFQRKKIVWVSFLLLDIHLHKTSQIQILRYLAKRGYEVYLLAVHSKKRFLSETTDIHVISIPLRYAPLVSNAIFVLSLFLFFPFFVLYLKPDFIVAEPRDVTVLGLMSTLLLPRTIRPKIVLDIRSTPVERVGLLGYVKTLFFDASVRIARKLFDGITIITPLMKKEICDKFHIDPKLVGVWTSGVSTELFKPEKYIVRQIEFKRRIGLNDKFVIIYHGAFSFKRGIIETVDSIAFLGGEYRKVVLFLLGSGPALPNLKRLIQKKGIQDRVVIHRPVDYKDVPEYVAMCDVGIAPLPDIPDWRNQCPLNLLEYLAMRKVVIVTDIPANREIVGKSKCGIYVSSADPREIAKAIMYAYDNRKVLKEWGFCGRAIVEEKYDWKKVAKDFESYLINC